MQERKELPPQFADTIRQLKEMRKYKTRKWTASQATITTVSGVQLTLPIWAREGGGFDHNTTDFPAGKSSRRNSIDGLAEKPPSFLCPEENCGKAFDTREKLKRHANLHKKKMKLKLPNLKLLHSHSQVVESLPDSELPSELVIDEHQSQFRAN